MGKPFCPVPPFQLLSSLHTTIPSNAIYFATILAIQRWTSKSMELLRQRQDVYNDMTGFLILWPYYHFILNYSEQRLVTHNRLVGSTVVLAVLYANFLA